MTQVSMQALSRQNYGGRWVLAGDTFQVDDSDVQDLEGIRPPLAKRVAQPVKVATPQVAQVAQVAAAQQRPTLSVPQRQAAPPPIAQRSGRR